MGDQSNPGIDVIYVSTTSAPRLVSIGERGLPGQSGFLERVYSFPIGAHRAVTLEGYADPAVQETSWTYLGISLNSGPGVVQIATSRVVEETGWNWTPLELVYIGTLGILTQSVPEPPWFVKSVGLAISPTAIKLVEYPALWQSI